MIELDEADVPLRQPPREQAVRRVRAGLPRLRSVHLEDRVGLLRQIHQVRHRRLHPIRHLVLTDARFDFRIAVRLVADLIELLHRIQHLPPGRLADPRRILEEQHRRAAGAESDALIARRQEPARPQPREERLIGVDGVRLREEHDERRQVLVLAAEPVTEPRAHARTARLLKAGLDERDRRIVIDRFRVHRLDDGDVVHDLCRVRKQFADPRARLTVLRELERRLRDQQLRLPHRLRDALPLPNGIRNLCALQLHERGLVVKCLELRRTAGLMQEDDALRLRREVRQPDQSAGLRIARLDRGSAANAERSGPSSVASAPMPMPCAERPKNWRRVR